MPGFSNGTVFADNVDFTGGANPAPKMNTNGELIIGNATTGRPTINTLSSIDTSVTITNGAGTIDLSVSSTIKKTIFTSSGLWTKDSRAKYIELYGWSGGSGGGSGARGASTAMPSGGGGAVGEGGFYYFGPTSLFGVTENVIVGLGGAGGAAVLIDDTNGNVGSLGGQSAFGNIWTTPSAFGDSAGRGGIVGGGAGASLAGGFVSPYVNATTGLTGGSSGTPGANGSDSPSSLGFGSEFGRSFFNGAGGGGGNLDVGDIPYDGGRGGNINIFNPGITVVLAGGAAGTVGAGQNGGAGTPGGAAITSGGLFEGGTGGGGGAANAGAAAGTGGNGAIPGGGGGGGGASLNGNASGRGGDGARGEVWVIEYL